MADNIDLEVLKMTVKNLGPLNESIAYLGGATISLFITEPEWIKIRETYDVDCVVEVASRKDYEAISKKLRSIGYSEDKKSKVMCRFRKEDLLLDVMPTNSKILGFTNIWYKLGYDHSIEKNIDGQKIKVFDLPYLIATKIEAFKGRGQGEFLFSHDVEDIVTLIDGRSSIVSDLNNAREDVKKYLITELRSFIKNHSFISSLDAHISDRENLAGRKEIVLSRIKAFTGSE